eukprot:1158028-Pelagomonas_calceolata.AAC.1
MVPGSSHLRMGKRERLHAPAPEANRGQLEQAERNIASYIYCTKGTKGTDCLLLHTTMIYMDA